MRQGDEQGLMPEGFGFQSQSDEKPQEGPEKEHNMLSYILGRFPWELNGKLLMGARGETEG